LKMEKGPMGKGKKKNQAWQLFKRLVEYPTAPSSEQRWLPVITIIFLQYAALQSKLISLQILCLFPFSSGYSMEERGSHIMLWERQLFKFMKNVVQSVPLLKPMHGTKA
jgi:hypothetical protein